METPTVNSPASAKAPVRVILFDLWKTIARGPYPEPIANFRSILGLDGKVDDEQFLRVCLTTPYEDPAEYMMAIARYFRVETLPETALEEFRALIRKEDDGLVIFKEVSATLQRLKQAGYRLGLVTNSWPFPVRSLLEWTQLDMLFEHVISSSEVGLAKQDGKEIYELAAQVFKVSPEECAMVGDNPDLDKFPADDANYGLVIVIDRYEDHIDGNGFAKRDPRLLGARYVRSLDQLHDTLNGNGSICRGFVGAVR